MTETCVLAECPFAFDVVEACAFRLMSPILTLAATVRLTRRRKRRHLPLVAPRVLGKKTIVLVF
jgi:hypothetical protein